MRKDDAGEGGTARQQQERIQPVEYWFPAVKPLQVNELDLHYAAWIDSRSRPFPLALSRHVYTAV